MSSGAHADSRAATNMRYSFSTWNTASRKYVKHVVLVFDNSSCFTARQSQDDAEPSFQLKLLKLYKRNKDQPWKIGRDFGDYDIILTDNAFQNCYQCCFKKIGWRSRCVDSICKLISKYPEGKNQFVIEMGASRASRVESVCRHVNGFSSNQLPAKPRTKNLMD